MYPVRLQFKYLSGTMPTLFHLVQTVLNHVVSVFLPRETSGFVYRREAHPARLIVREGPAYLHPAICHKYPLTPTRVLSGQGRSPPAP